MADNSNMNDEQLKSRTKQFALRVIRLSEAMPDSRLGRTVAGQILRAGTSVGANYRAAMRAKSPADFVHKMGIVEEEADEIVAMVVSSIRTARNKT